MLKLIRKHQKKLLAIFTAGLMVVFVIDIGIRRMAPRQVDPSQKVIGQFGDTEVHLGELQTADYILRQLLTRVLVPADPPRPGQPQFQSIVEAIGVPGTVVRGWVENPLAFLLLEKEARLMPVYVDQRQLDFWMSRAALRLPDERIVKISDAPDFEDEIRAEIATLLLVRDGFNRIGDILKVSQPLAGRTAVEESQLLTVWALTLKVQEFLPQAPQPTAEQLGEFFAKYANIPPGTLPTESDPLGIGYRFPPRVKLQYVALPREELRKVIRARKDDYTWERDANRYYLEHPKDFPTTAPTTQPATQPSVRPFEEVREQVLQKLMAPDVQKLGDEIRKKIENTITLDYDAYARANPPSTAPSTRPSQPVVSSLGVAYDSYEYLERLAQSIQQQFGVLPTTASIAELKSEVQIAEMPGIGFVASEVFERAAPLATSPPQTDAKPLHLWQPSKPQTDDAGTTYSYRLTEASPAHAPVDVSEVAEKVKEDWKTAWAWDQAKSEAQKLLDAAKNSSLSEVAGARKVLAAGPFQRFTMAPIGELELGTIEARAKFLTDAYKLVAEITPQREHPAASIPLPTQREVLVVQLASLESGLSAVQLELAPVRQPLVMRQQWSRYIVEPWFSFSGVASRLGYVDREGSQRSRSAAASP